MASSIIKCYDTERNAKNGAGVGLIASTTVEDTTDLDSGSARDSYTVVDTFPYAFTVDSISNAIYNRADNVPFFIFNEYWFRFESNDPVVAFHVDWDDGDDNSENKANFEIIPLEKPGFWAVTSHIYSKLGRFWPLIRAESPIGFLSKWYTSDNNEEYLGLRTYEYKTGATTVPHGANNTFVIREEKTSALGGAVSYRIPHMRPANLPPVAVLKSDRKRIFAGIDNDQIEYRAGQQPLLYAYTDLDSLPAITVTMEVEDEDTGQVKEYSSIPLQNTASLSSWDSSDTENDAVPTGSIYTSGSFETQVIAFGAGDTVGQAQTTNSFNNKYFRFANQHGSTNFIATFLHPNVEQVYDLTILTDTPAQIKQSSASVYIDLMSDVDGVEETQRYWLDCTGSDTSPGDPTPIGSITEIPINSLSTRNAIASAIAIAINAGTGLVSVNGGTTASQFTAVAIDNVVRITDTGGAAVSNWTINNENNTYITFVEITDGENPGVAQALEGHTAIPVTFASGAIADTLASLAADAINANSNFRAVVGTEGTSHKVTITPMVTGDMKDPIVATVNGSTAANDAPSLTVDSVVDGTSTTGSSNPAKRLYKAKLSDIDTLGDDDRIYIKVHNFDLESGGATKPVSTDNTVAVLSNGNPIIEITDNLSKAMLDGGESLTRAGNVDIKNYYFDVDKNLLGAGVSSTSVQSISSNVGELSALFTDYFNNFKDSSKEVAYAHHNKGFTLDTYGRFKDFSKLCRLQVEDNSASFINETAILDGCRITRSDLDLTVSTAPIGIHTIQLSGRGSFTKDAKITQIETAAVAATIETTNSFSATDADDSGTTLNIDSTSIDITAGRSAVQVATTVAATTFPNYTAAVTSTDKVTFTQKVAGQAGNIAIVATDLEYGVATVATGVVTCRSVINTDTVTANGLVYTAVTGSPAEGEFDISSADDHQVGDNLTAAINADTRTGTHGDLVATNPVLPGDPAIVTITNTVAGAAGNTAFTVKAGAELRLVLSGPIFTGGQDIHTISFSGASDTFSGGVTQRDATGYVLQTTNNQNYVQLYDTSEVSTFDSDGTNFVETSAVLSSDTTGDSSSLYPLDISKGNVRIPRDYFLNGLNAYSLQYTNRSGLSSHADNFAVRTTVAADIPNEYLSGDHVITVASNSNLRIGDILKIESEYMKITAISGTTITVKRAYFSSTAAAHVVTAKGTITCAGVLAADTVTVNGLVYTAVAGTKADNTKFSIDTSNTACATDLADSITNDVRSGSLNDVTATSVAAVVTCSQTVIGTGGNATTLVSSNGTRLAVSGATFSGGNNLNISQGTANWGTASPWTESSWADEHTSMPENFIYLSKSEKFNSIFLRTAHTFLSSAAAGAANGPAKIRLGMWYSKTIPPNKDSTEQFYDWSPLPFKDYTDSLQTSGNLCFVPPEDWAFCTNNDLTENNGTYNSTEEWKGPVKSYGVGSYTPQYHILIGWSSKDSSNTVSDMVIENTWVSSNSHSLTIDVIDPHHVSLNSIAIADSIAYNRQGKYTMVEDRLGKIDIRRIGAQGGSVTFGGVDLGSTSTGRLLMKEYQQNGTPVFLDVEHKSGVKTRFFGVVTKMSEDMPAGKGIPKWSITLQCSYCIEMDSTGVMTSEKISLGGVMSDVYKYLLQS